MTKNLTPPHLRCTGGSFPGVWQLEDGRLLIVGLDPSRIDSADDPDLNRQWIAWWDAGNGIAWNESKVVISPDLLSAYVAEKVEEARAEAIEECIYALEDGDWNANDPCDELRKLRSSPEAKP